MKEFQSIRRLLSTARRAADVYRMIQPGDRIAVGLSGGKDSVALLCTLYNLQRFYPAQFDLCAVTIDMGFEGMDFSPAIQFCHEAGIEYRVVPTELAKIVFEYRKESNPCSLCAKMRRGALHDAALEMGCNKIALGHHMDDVVDTFMLNLLHEGRIGSFAPVTYLSRKKITVIRPFVFTPEKDIQYFMRRNPGLPLIRSLCPEDKHTERETVHQMINAWDREHKGVRHRLFGALQRAGIDGYGIGTGTCSSPENSELCYPNQGETV